MSDLNPRGIPIMLDGVERHFLFTLNTIDELEDKYGKNLYDVLIDMTSGGRNADHLLRDIVTVLLNAEADREKRLGGNDISILTEHDVGFLIGMDNYGEVVIAIMKAFGLSMPEPDEEDDPKTTGGRRIK